MVKIILFVFLMSVNLFAYSEPLVDPTKPLNFQQQKSNKVYRAAVPKLQSIMIKEGQQHAILNNKIYKKGQWVSGYKIIQIDADTVLLMYQEKTYKLTLYSTQERFTH